MARASAKSESGFVDNWQSGKSLAQSNLYMLNSEDSCDVSFRVGKHKELVRAHRYVLISRSCVFHAMFCGPLAEKGEITITDVETDIFRELLRYLYTNDSKPTPVNATGLLYLAKKYDVGGLEHLCLTYLKSSLSAENACVILEEAHVYDETELYDTAMKVIFDKGHKCFGTEGFKHLCRECFHKVISSNCPVVKAEQIFSAAMAWAEEQCKSQRREVTPTNLRSMLGQTVYCIPFQEMNQKRYVKEVLPKQILTSDENVNIMANFICGDSLPTPFKRKLSSYDVTLYKNHKRFVNSKMEELYGAIDFNCDHDVLLLGVYVYGSASSDDKYKLSIGRVVSEYEQQRYVNGKDVSTSNEKIKDKCIGTIRLKKPLWLTRSNSYFVSVDLLDRRQPVYCGAGDCEQVTADHCDVSNINDDYIESTKLIYGLIFRK